jgi:hypothetical protein
LADFPHLATRYRVRLQPYLRKIISLAFSAIMIVGAFVLPEMSRGIIEV